MAEKIEASANAGPGVLLACEPGSYSTTPAKSELDWGRINAVLDRTAHLALPLRGLEGELRDAREAASILHARRLESLGVSRATIAELGLMGWGVVNAIDHPTEPGLYCLDPAGAPHLVLPVYEGDELVDLVAFRSSAPDHWLLRNGCGWALGLQRGLEAHAWEPASLAVSPLDWLRQGASGLCVLDWDAPEVRHLADVPHLVCRDEEHADVLRTALTRPVRFPEISTMEARLVA